MATTLLLIRHGDNEWIKSGKLAGRTPGIHLNDQGRGQARRLAARLAAWPLAACYSSPLERCHETALIVAAPHGLPVAHHPGLLETDYGEWQGREIAPLLHDPLWRVVQSTPSLAQFPGGESLQQMQQRMLAALSEIAGRHPDQVVAICAHADLIKAAVAHFLGSHFDHFQRIHISTGSVSVVVLQSTGPVVLRVNDTGLLPPPPAAPAPPDPEKNDE